MSDENDHPSGLPLLLKVPRVAGEFDCSGRHVYDLVEQGLLDLVKLGNKASRITRESVLRLAAQRTKPADHMPGLKQFSEAKPKRITAPRRDRQRSA